MAPTARQQNWKETKRGGQRSFVFYNQAKTSGRVKGPRLTKGWVSRDVCSWLSNALPSHGQCRQEQVVPSNYAKHRALLFQALLTFSSKQCKPVRMRSFDLLRQFNWITATTQETQRQQPVCALCSDMTLQHTLCLGNHHTYGSERALSCRVKALMLK